MFRRIGVAAATAFSSYALLAYILDAKKKTRPFLTQVELFKSLKYNDGRACEPIFCHPMSSDWLRKKIEKIDTDYLKNEEETLISTVSVNDDIHALKKDGKDYLNYAFVKTKTAYKEKNVPLSELTTKEGVEQSLATHQYAFFRYPTRDPNQGHAVAYHRDEKGGCEFFDPNYPGGEVSHACPELYDFIAARIRETGAKNLDQTEYATLTVDTPIRTR